MFMVLTFIALVASFSIVSNLIMLVTEKAREVAILKSMGARDGAILRDILRRGAVHRPARAGCSGWRSAWRRCLLLSRYGLPLDPDVYYIQKLPVVMRAERDRARSAWRRWCSAAWRPSTRRCWRPGCARWTASATSER